MNTTRHARFVILNTFAAALASAAVFSLVLGVLDPSVPPAHGRDVAFAYVVRMTTIAGLANVVLYPIIARCDTWIGRSIAFCACFAACLVAFAAWTVASDTLHIDPAHATTARLWLAGVLVFYGAFLGAPMLALDLLLNRALHRHLFA